MDIFKDNQAEDYHVFVSDSEWMKELGLSTFTTGILYDWWYAKDEQKRYMNRAFLGPKATESSPESSNESPSIFFAPSGTWAIPGNPADGTMEPWRFTGEGKGKYEKDGVKSQTWSYIDDRATGDDPMKGGNYGVENLNMEEFNGFKYLAPTGIEDEGSFVPLLKPSRLGGGGDVDEEDQGIGKNKRGITNIIAMNDWVRAWETKYPDKKDWDEEAKARYEFIDDIKTSKAGCLTFSVGVEFDIAPGQLVDTSDLGESEVTLGPALKTEDFIIKLYLYDDKSVRKTGRTAILTSTKHAAVPVDDLGRAGRMADGELEEVDETDPSQKVAGDIDLVLSSKTGNWKSGNKQILAKIVDEVSSATWTGDVDELAKIDIEKEMLDDPDNPSHLVMGTGTAMPITMQNGNPMQWTPNYAKPKGCRKDDKTKAIVKVLNPSDKVFPKGKVVLLNEVNDVWMPMDFGVGLASDGVITSSFQGRWDFTYFATSLAFFFRDDKQKKVTLDLAEQGFHVGYYDGDPLNGADQHYPNVKALTVEHGYHQFSSFDFMDHDIGGTRGTRRSLGATVWGIDPLDATLDDPRGPVSGPFFGCIFPNGYKSSTDEVNGANDYVSNRSWNVKGLEGGKDKRGHEGQFFHNYAGINSNIGDLAIPGDVAAMKDEIPSDKHAYNESPKNETGELIPMFAAGDNEVPHLPADIATHCSPSGLHGRPITNMAHLKDVIHGTLVGTDLQNHMRDTFFDQTKGAYKWLYKTSDTPDEYNVYDSAFDFKPRTANKIQFRPLKMEVYASLVPGPINHRTTDCEREEIWYKIATKMNDSIAPASNISREREKAVTPPRDPCTPGEACPSDRWESLYRDGQVEDHWDNDNHFGYGLGWNVDYTNQDFQKWNNSERFSKYHFTRGYNSSAYNSFMRDPPRPAGAVGVIGAIATASASMYIEFYTNQVIGMQSDFLNGSQYPTWGGYNLGYDDFQTTDLSVRIYQAWPREQTIYDPRFFAVHHFNHGVTLSDNVFSIQTVATDTNGNGNLDHNIHVAESTVDTREPTFVYKNNQIAGGSNELGPFEALRCPLDTKIFKDGVKFDLVHHPLLPSGQWNINPQRRGKLLPFKYENLAVSIPWFVSFSFHIGVGTISQSEGVYFSGGLPQTHLSSFKYIDDPNYPDKTTKNVQNVKLVIQNLGQNYLKGDQFKVLGSDAILEVESVTNWAVTSGVGTDDEKDYFYTGSIESFKVSQNSTYFDTNKLLPSGDDNVNPVKSFTQGAAKLEPLTSTSVNGKGFKAYIAQAVVGKIAAIDAKPKIATSEDYYQLSAPANNSQGGPTSPPENSTMIFVEPESRLVQADIDTDNASADGLYDLFFHFHNDVSHTWMTDDFGPLAQHRDQYIDLTITPV